MYGHGLNSDVLYQESVTWKDCYRSAIESFNILRGMTDKVYIMGSSFGGTLAYLMGIELENNATGVIAVSSPTHSKYNPPNHHWANQVHLSMKAVEHNVHNLNIPVLIMHGVDDKVVKVKHALFAFDKVRTEQKKMIIYNQIGHSLGFGFNTNEVANDLNNFIISNREPVPVRFELDYHDAGKVSLTGEFNNWDANSLPMFNDQGRWKIDVLLAPGDYQYKFVIDNSRWILDPSGEKIYTPKGQLNSIVRVS